MDKFTLDCRQLENLDLSTLPAPTLLPVKPPRKPLSAKEQSALRSALKFGKAASPKFAPIEEVVDLGTKAVKAALLVPAKMPTAPKMPIIKFSACTDLTVALGVAGSGAAVATIIASVGVYGSTTREVGIFATLGGGVTFNTPSAQVGGEVTLVFGTPWDLAGPYFGIAVGAGTGIAVTGTLLFSPTMPLTNPMELTFMGVSLNLSATLPTKLPVSVTIEVTETTIYGLKVF